MREFIKREAKQTVTVREVPERVVKELDAIWERLGFEDTQIKVSINYIILTIFYRLHGGKLSRALPKEALNESGIKTDFKVSYIRDIVI